MSGCVERTAVQSQVYWLYSRQTTNHSTIDQQSTAGDKTDVLLRILSDVPDSQQQLVFNKLLLALRQDGKEHVANIFRLEYDARPMSDEHYQLLHKTQNRLRQCLDPSDELIDQLVINDVFTDKDTYRIMSKTECMEKVQEMIDIILH